MALGVYKPRNPRNTRLWRILHRYFNAFQDAYEKRYGYIRRIVVKRVHAYLKCGILDFGFARVRCPKCRHEYLVAFSCKARGICPSCQAKRQAEFSAFISRDVLHQVPHRQVVLSVPRRLRPYFLHNRRLLAKLARCGYDTVRDLLTSAFKGKSSPGAIVCIQTFGSLLDFHPHLHILVSWGLFHGNGCFHPLHAVPSADSLSRLFRHKVLRMLLKQGAIDQDIVDNMLSWRHTGFGADIGAELQPGKGVSRTPQHALLEYMVRAPVADNRITIGDNTIIYKADRIHPRHGGNFRIFDPMDFIRQVIAHIPNAHEKSVIYYGWYSNRSRGLRKKQENKQAAPARDREKETPIEVRRAWAAMIQRVYEADPLTCPSCGSEMVIVSFIEDEDVVFKILNHLNLLDGGRPNNFRARASPQLRPVSA